MVSAASHSAILMRAYAFFNRPCIVERLQVSSEVYVAKDLDLLGFDVDPCNLVADTSCEIHLTVISGLDNASQSNTTLRAGGQHRGGKQA